MSPFTDEPSCLQRLIARRWPHGVLCPRCQTPMTWRASRMHFECERCHKQLSPTAGTVFHKSRLPLSVWFEAMRKMLLSEHGISARALQTELRLKSYRAAWLLAQKIRRAMLSAFAKPALPLTEARFISRRQLGKVHRQAPSNGGTPQGWSSKYHAAYAAEIAFRLEAQKDPEAAFERLLDACIRRKPATLRDITT